jgi:pimeloyl-ACP methyl ester carboxylesterase
MSKNNWKLLTAVAPIALILAPYPAYAGPVASSTTIAVGETRMDHISIITMGRKGTPVVLIPGLATPRAVWDGVAPGVARKHRVILVQVNGFGGDDPGANLKPDILAGIVADLDAYIATNRLTNVAVVGHSMGGLVAMMLANAHREHVAKVMIVDSLPFFAVLKAPPGVDVTPAMVAPQAAIARDRIAATYGKPISDADADSQTKGLALKPESIAKMKSWAVKADPRVTAEVLYEDLVTDLRPDLPAIKAPITVLYPWNATYPTKDKAAAFYRQQYASAPNVKFVDIGDAAHFVMLDQPAAFQAAIDTFANGN